MAGIKLLGWLLFFVATSIYALPEDEQKEAILGADTADLNQQNHRGEYVGRVEFDQGTRHLRAAKAITEGNAQNKLSLAIAYGNNTGPAHYWEKTAADKPELHAYADEIRYYPEKHLIELIGNAKVIQGENSFSAAKISYDTLKQHVSTTPVNNIRTLIVIHPSKKS